MSTYRAVDGRDADVGGVPVTAPRIIIDPSLPPMFPRCDHTLDGHRCILRTGHEKIINHVHAYTAQRTAK
jgi:hypothetical protein